MEPKELCSYIFLCIKYTIFQFAILTSLSVLETGLSLNKLSLNVKKTKMMVFHNRQNNITDIIPKLEINGIPIEHVKQFNFLGIKRKPHQRVMQKAGDLILAIILLQILIYWYAKAAIKSKQLKIFAHPKNRVLVRIQPNQLKQRSGPWTQVL